MPEEKVIQIAMNETTLVALTDAGNMYYFSINKRKEKWTEIREIKNPRNKNDDKESLN